MYGDNHMRVRPSALFPFVFSIIAFALILVLVLSGTQPNSVPDGYLLSFNTTSVGRNLVEFNPASPPTTVTPSVNVTSRSVIANSSASNSTNNTNPSTSISSPPNLNVSISTTSNSSSNSNSTSSAAPILVIPQAAVASNPAAIPISLIGTFFQLTLNTLASGMGQTLQNVVSLLATNGKQSLGVNQYYTMHLSGICEGSVSNASATANSTSPFNITHCVSYEDAGAYLANLTRTVSDSTLVAATNITIPFLSTVPSLGKSVKSLMDTASAIILTVFIISLIGNGLSIILSAAAFALPSYGAKIHAAAAAVTTISTQLLQLAAITSTTIAVSISTAINHFSNVSGLSATVGGKFLALIWVGYIAAQMANGYWVVTWFVKFRTVAYKARRRTPQQMTAGYKGIGREVWSDLRLQGGEDEDTEVLTKRKLEIRHLNGDWQQM